MNNDTLRYVLDPDNFTGSVLTSMHDGVHSDYGNHETIEELRVRENNTKLMAITREELYPLWVNYQESLQKPFEEITEKRYYELKNCLPPERWINSGFFVGEPYYGNLYSLCFNHKGKYYSALRNIRLSDETLEKQIIDFIKLNTENAV